MGDDKLDSMLYTIDRETGEEYEIGRGIPEISKLAPGGLEFENIFFEEAINEREIEFTVMPKTITKKRFIKLLMGKGYQRNEAIKIHKEYMKKYKVRSRIGLEVFINIRDKQLENVEYKLESEDN